MSSHHGVSFPTDSSTAAARTIMADALRSADPVGARHVEDDTNWRRGYLSHFRRAVEAGLTDTDAALSIAANGLDSAHSIMRFDDMPLGDAIARGPRRNPLTAQVLSGAAAADEEFTLPYRDRRLRGAELIEQLGAWVDRGIITQSCADAVVNVQQNPEWLRLEGRTVVVLGAGAEMGPYRALQRWGAQVAAVDLERDAIQARIRDVARDGAGRTALPLRPDGTVGANLLTELPELADWLLTLDGQLVLGNYCYADGGTHVRLSMAADALGQHLVAQRPDTALAFLATPTDAFVAPVEEVDRANAQFKRRGPARVARLGVRAVSAGRLLQRNYPPVSRPAVCDALVPQQGPNYALAKRLQRWRATTARAQGTAVSLNVAPATRTRSVVKNKALAAAYAGAHRFGVEIFDPATSNTLMAALLVHDLNNPAPPSQAPWQDEANQAAHGGLWTAAYHPRSALGLAAVLGIGALRN
jgi:hypothetical protein